MFPLCLKGINLNTTLKYPDFLWASRVKSGIWRMFCISKTRAGRGTLVLILESAGQIYPETGLTFEVPKCVLASDYQYSIERRGDSLSRRYPLDVGKNESFLCKYCDTAAFRSSFPVRGVLTIRVNVGVCHLLQAHQNHFLSSQKIFQNPYP